ncbi:MAG: YjgP/YjgQ family permease [Aquificae bacterium]|nr:YjgP/YjgQ family permease [Aquificota bacterium]
MKKLYMYLYKRYFVYLFIIFPSFVAVTLLADVIELLRKIKVMVLGDILLYILYQVPEKVYYVLPISTVIALIFLARELINRNEIYAVLTSGISVRSLSVALIFLTGLITFFQIVNVELLMPDAKAKSIDIYKKLKTKKDKNGEEVSFAYNTWVSLEEDLFLYFDFIDFENKRGKNLVLIKFDKNYYPVYRVESKRFEILESSIETFSSRVIVIQNIDKIDVQYVKQYTLPFKIDIDDLKQLVAKRKPVSLTQLYETAKIAQEYGHKYSYYWSKFYSKLASIFAPTVLSIFAVPFVWTRKKNRLFFIFIGIMFYWYLIALISSISATGLIPYQFTLAVDVVFLFVGIFSLLRLRFIEL